MPQNPFSNTLEALNELVPEIQAAQRDPRSVLPGLSEVLAEFSPFPRTAIFLGLANDGLPVLLNLKDPLPGPILITGDRDSGKTLLLQTIARAVTQTHQPEEVEYLVLTDSPAEWDGPQAVHCRGVFSTDNPDINRVLASLSARAHENKGGPPFSLLLIDNLEALVKSTNSNPDLRWLLLRGPARHIWPIVTLETESLVKVPSWLEAFRTRLFGHMESDRDASLISRLPDISFQILAAGYQFAMREGNAWIQFWIPNSD